jgi:transglutaminase-like putative cysteine protease
MPVFKIHHITKYEYDRPVSESINEIRIFPFQCPEQEVLQHDLLITGQPEVQVFNDYWGNKTGLFSLIESHRQLTIESKLIVRTTMASQLRVNFHSGFSALQQESSSSLQLLELTRPDSIEQQNLIREITAQVYAEGKSVAHTVEHSSEFIFKHFKYTKGITTIETTVDEILQHQGGVCQDFAHVLLQILRTLNIPCRYVSGYICPNKNGMRGEGATHAWVEAWIPGFGWAGIDPTNNVWVTNNHVKLAVGRNFGDCSPIKGTFKGPSRQDLFVFVSVGYEDGHIFQETTRVKLEKQEKTAEEEEVILIAESFAAQQQ